jgi:naphthoate synthase
MTAFVEKRPARYRELREMAGRDESVEFLWGPYRHTCGECGAKGIPANFEFCGACGARLERDDG